MITVDEAIDIVHREVRPPGDADEEGVPLLDAVGRVASRDLVSDVDLPPFSRSTMDGFALIAADADRPGVTLEVVGESAAGSPFDGEVTRGQAARIFTGAPLPSGADAVCMVEQTEERDGRVTLQRDVVAGQNISRQAEDLADGQVALAKGTSISAAQIGLLASIGAVEPRVYRRPTVAILATGSELLPPDERPRGGMIRESNSFALAALVRQAGGEPVLLPRVIDDPAEIEARTAEGLGHDVLLVTGGSSVGDYDFTPDVFAAHGIAAHFDRVSLKPGKPTLFGTRGDRVVFGLPGNPISAFVVFHLFVRPALWRRLGLADEQHARLGRRPVARLVGSAPRNRKREQFLPARLGVDDGTLTVRFCGWNGSGDVTCLRHADALMRVTSGEEPLVDGAPVEVLPLLGGRVGDVSFGPR